ncbi:GTP-binding protein [Ruegeria sp. Ofav3-42]|uniref:CobW family GTP-binding protein n=1 Tax=Ruegeria sp. Ofav3-42 TaxID=2917759 RepID=UPI001EF65020|nr:GTP-binding protein [Ruegeria sp. Ofav3-42]MCG7522626.1 GTP-binding protein [Ruegeria sp. Ofav3-42]
METLDNRIPVTLLTGFLGAGKTTLLNHLIRDPLAGRIAVVMNELGDAGLDHDLIEESTEDVVLMQSGCLCCSIRGDLAQTMESLFKRNRSGELSFDRVVIETTGIADPGPILHTMVVDSLIAQNFRMDGVVTLADAATGPNTLDAQFEAVNQIAMADLIVVTKTDLVTPIEKERFEARLTGINSTARRVTAQHGQVPAGVLFGLSAMRSSVTPDEINDWLGTEMSKPDPLAGLSGFAPKATNSAPFTLPAAGAHAHHDNRITSASIEVPDPIPASVFDFWLDTLIALKGPGILRMKGIVHVQGMEWPFVFHGVQHIFDAPVPLKSWSGYDTTSRVVVIARDIDEGDLKTSLNTLRIHSTELEARTEGMMVHTTETSV